jgi:RND family efflux transporter MFP subunit
MRFLEKTMPAVCAGIFALLALAGCNDDGHGHEHAEESGDHGHEHAEESGAGHAHEESDRPAHVVTMLGEHTELFVEFPALVAGAGSKFAAHFTTLDDYQPVRKGKLTVVLTSDDAPGENWQAESPASPGIFTPTATPKYDGTRRLFLIVETDDFTDRFDLGELSVFETKAAARKVEIENPEGEISFLKEQQWKVDFGVARATNRKMRPSVAVNATLRPASDGEAAITAPFDGRISAPSDGIAQVGRPVEAGQVIAYVIPSLGAGDISELRSELRKAKVELDRAQREVERLEQLAKSGAIASKRLEDAVSSREIAQAEVQRAQMRLRQSQNIESHTQSTTGRIAIRSPIAGTVAQRTLVDGGFVSSGDQLMHVVDRANLWLEAHVPEADLPRIEQPSGAWFEPGAEQAPVEIDVNDGDELISFGEVIDPKTRTVPLIFALGDSLDRPELRVGGFVKAHIFTDQPRESLAIPASAVLDEKGLDVVFVMKGGESFERRTVRLGVRDRGMVEVLDGLARGDHVVSEGVYYIKLAGTSTGSVGHGHAH